MGSQKAVDAMSAAWDEAEAAPEAAPEADAAPVVEAVEADAAPAVEAVELHQEEAPLETAAEKAQRLRDEAGRFTKAPKERAAPAAKGEARAGAAKQPLKPSPAPEKPVVAKPPAPAAAAQAAELKAPAGWKPTAREHWAKLPPEVQAEAVRREKEAAVAVTKAAELEKQLQPWAQTLAPHQALLQATGVSPHQAVGSMLQMANTLAYAPMPQKAAALARVISAYGVDVGALAAALEGGPANHATGAGQGQQAQAPQQGFNPDALLKQAEERVMSRLQAERQQAMVARHQQELQSFAQGREFLEDVRADMADILDLAAKRGLQLSLEEAYNRACMLHPEVSVLVKQREAAKQALANQAKVSEAKAASSSVRGRPALGSPNGARPLSRRELLEAAWDSDGRK